MMAKWGNADRERRRYPRPPVLRSLIASMADGEIFYHIRNGIRNTGMPAWNLPDQQVWQLVLYMRDLPKTAPMSVVTAAGPPNGLAAWAGATPDPESCKTCHFQHLRTVEEDADGQRRT